MEKRVVRFRVDKSGRVFMTEKDMMDLGIGSGGVVEVGFDGVVNVRKSLVEITYGMLQKLSVRSGCSLSQARDALAAADGDMEEAARLLAQR